MAHRPPLKRATTTRTHLKRGRAKLETAPLTAERWDDLEELFGERGACGGCWCMAWRLTTKDWEAGRGSNNRRALRRIVTAGREPGILGYTDGEPVAWLAIAAREEYSRLSRSRTLAAIDDEPVWSISCFFLRRDHRRQGRSVQLLRAACAFAAEHGARIVEGYPIEPTMEKTPDAFVWTGIPSAFLRAGFEEVERRSRTRPIMRRRVRRPRRL